MNSLKLTLEEKGQIDEIQAKTERALLEIENHNLKVELLKHNITQLANSSNGIIGQFCKVHGKDINDIAGYDQKTGEIFFKEAESENKDKEA